MQSKIKIQVPDGATQIDLYEIEFSGSYRIRRYDVEPNKEAILVLPVSREEFETIMCDGGYFLKTNNGLVAERKDIVFLDG